MNVIAFTLLQDGIPIIYYGQEQHLSGGTVPYNREALWSSGGYDTSSQLYGMITTINTLRTHAISLDSGFTTYHIQTPYVDSNNIVTRKGDNGYQIVGVYTNNGESAGSSTLAVSSSVTGFSAGESVMEVLSCTLLTASADGTVAVPMSGGVPRILYAQANLKGSGLCSTYNSASVVITLTAADPDCTTATFNIKVQTQYGQNIKIAGNIPQLGNWSPSDALPLSASEYTSSNPLWTGTAYGIAPQDDFQWKPILINSDGSVEWYPGANLENESSGACSGSQLVINQSWSA